MYIRTIYVFVNFYQELIVKYSHLYFEILRKQGNSSV